MRYTSRLAYILFIASLLFCSSCVNYKKLIYLNDDGGTYSMYPTPEYLLKPNDILSIDLQSLENTSGYFNETSLQGNQSGGAGQVSPGLFYISGYLISKDGYIDLPIVGRVEAAGSTTKEVEERINAALTDYIKFTYASVKLVNFRVTVSGEVSNPGVQYVYENKYTLLQALAQAGNLTDFGNRTKVKLVRESADSLQSVYLDITEPELISSEYYFLQSNDLIYVEPVRAKTFNVNTRVPAVLLSIIIAGLTVVNFIK